MTPAKKTPAEAKPAKAAAKAPPKKAAAAPQAKQPKLPKPKWDVCEIDEWGPEGGWRSEVPQIDSEKCDGCLLCYFYCPDASIIIECGKAAGVDLAHCKGCGICAKECPKHAIVMKPEEKE
jgi:pyruvate ferredoxin oxidoreductase delta subunit